jgi:ribose transport system permease protein
VKFAAYTLLGALTGLAAFLHGAQYTSINSATSGLNLELDAIAAVVIGGTRMEGGRGGVAGTVVGVVLLGVIRNMMVMLGVNTYAQGLVQGLIIVAAVLAQRTQKA